jgi:hypothetical protein
MDTRQKIRFFQLANQRPVNSEFQMELPADVRVLLGSLLLEEAVEYAVKGLGLRVAIDFIPGMDKSAQYFKVEATDHPLNPKEICDGLADVDVVNHFCAHWHGFNLNYATHVANESNMTKLDDNGEPIINGVTPGYLQGEPGYDPEKPIGKILKSNNFREPDFDAVIAFGNPPYDPWDDVGVSLTPLHDYAEKVAAGDGDYKLDSEPLIDYSKIPSGSLGVLVEQAENAGIHLDSSEIRPAALLEHCSFHPDQTVDNCEGGYGLAGGGVGSYFTCGKCGNIFGKTPDSEEE